MNKSKIASILVGPETTIKRSMQRLNETGVGIIFVHDNKEIIGAITDGDIRRGIIHGLKFSDKAKKVMCTKFISLRSEEIDIKEKARKIMLEKQIEQIPVLDKDGLIVDVMSWIDVFGYHPKGAARESFRNKIVLMAGGKGERLDPFTKILPKPLIPIGDRSIVELIMERFYEYGFHNFTFTLNYKKEYLKTFFRENNFPYNIEWVEEPDFMGTAGSLSLLKDKINDSFFVTNCDVILDSNYADILKWHKKNGNFMTIIGCHKQIKIPYGVLEVNNGVLSSFVEKPNYDALINTGLYVLEPGVISLIPKNKPMDMNTLIEAARKKRKVSVYPVHEGWFDIGQWDEYKKSLKKLSSITKPELEY